MSEAENWFPEIELTKDVLPRVPLQEVLGLQALAMGVVRPLARTQAVSDDPHLRKFALLHATTSNPTQAESAIQMPDADGTYAMEPDVDTYLGVIVRKNHPRQWRLTISFLQCILTDAERLTNTRETYRFEWDKNQDEALGMHRIIHNVGKAISLMPVQATPIAWPKEQRFRNVETDLVTIDDCQDLRERLQTHADKIRRKDVDSTAA